MKKHFVIYLFVLGLFSCETKEKPRKPPQNHGVLNHPENLSKKSPKRNFLSHGMVQSLEEDKDRQITQSIRKHLMNDKTLSFIARNITVITEDGVVTLRGKVPSEVEKNKISQKINLIPSIVTLNNKLEVSND